jgi:hypothetical protein
LHRENEFNDRIDHIARTLDAAVGASFFVCSAKQWFVSASCSRRYSIRLKRSSNNNPANNDNAF